jgi:hypothetical protein
LESRNWALTTISGPATHQTTLDISMGASDVAVESSHSSVKMFRHLSLNIAQRKLIVEPILAIDC